MGCDVHGAGVESLEPITLGAVLIAILVLIITTQLIRNFLPCWSWRCCSIWI